MARNFLRAVAAGSRLLHSHCRKYGAEFKRIQRWPGGEIKGVNALNHLCDLFGIPDGDIHKRAEAVAQAVLDDLYRPDYVKMELLEKLAYARD